MHRLKHFFRDKWLEMAIIGIALQLMTSSLIIILGSNPFTMFMTGMILLLFMVVLIVAFDRLREGKKSISEGDALKTPRRGVIFSIGLKSHDANSTVMKTLKVLKPQYCAFIGTAKTIEANVSGSIVEALGLGPEFHKEKIIDPTDIRDIKRSTVDLIEWMLDRGLSEQDIVVDLTGGTAIMSVAAYMGAAENKIDTQYIYSEYRDNKPVEGTQKALMIKQI